MKLETLMQQPTALPTIPKVVQELIDSFQNDNVSIDDIAHKLAADQVLSAKVLRLANSAHYHVSRSIGTVDEAVSMLGFVTIRTLVISTGLTGGFKSLPGLDLKRFWRYSLHTACIARFLAKPLGQNADLAFTVGLMHAIGELVMYSGMPEPMLHLDRVAGPLDARRLDVERQSFGYTALDVGAELARIWRFPAQFSVAIKACGEPLAGASFDPLAALVHIASWRSRAEENQLKPAELEATWPAAVAERLALKATTVLQDMPPLAELATGMEDLVR